MNCEEIGELLPDYLQGRLSTDHAKVVEKHLAECATCGEEAALWKKLALLPSHARPGVVPPSPVRSDVTTGLQTWPAAGTG